jgi:multimeric flavodoxin WrbA
LILEKFCEADGVIIATPVYYYNVSAQLKAFIDRNYFLYMHDKKPQAKVVGLIVIAESSGIEDTLHALNQFLDETFAKKKVFTVSGYAGRCGDVMNNAKLVQDAKDLGRQIVEALR